MEREPLSESKYQCILALESLAFISAVKYHKSTGDKSLLTALYNILAGLHNENQSEADGIPKIPVGSVENDRNDNQTVIIEEKTETIENLGDKTINGYLINTKKTQKKEQTSFIKPGSDTYRVATVNSENETEIETEIETEFETEFESESDNAEADFDVTRSLGALFDKHDEIMYELDQMIADEGGYKDPNRLKTLLGEDYDYFMQIYPHIRFRHDPSLDPSANTFNATKSKRIFNSTAVCGVSHNKTFNFSGHSTDASNRTFNKSDRTFDQTPTATFRKGSKKTFNQTNRTFIKKPNATISNEPSDSTDDTEVPSQTQEEYDEETQRRLAIPVTHPDLTYNTSPKPRCPYKSVKVRRAAIGMPRADLAYRLPLKVQPLDPTKQPYMIYDPTEYWQEPTDKCKFSVKSSDEFVDDADRSSRMYHTKSPIRKKFLTYDAYDVCG